MPKERRRSTTSSRSSSVRSDTCTESPRGHPAHPDVTKKAGPRAAPLFYRDGRVLSVRRRSIAAFDLAVFDGFIKGCGALAAFVFGGLNEPFLDALGVAFLMASVGRCFALAALFTRTVEVDGLDLVDLGFRIEVAFELGLQRGSLGLDLERLDLVRIDLLHILRLQDLGLERRIAFAIGGMRRPGHDE